MGLTKQTMVRRRLQNPAWHVQLVRPACSHFCAASCLPGCVCNACRPLRPTPQIMAIFMGAEAGLFVPVCCFVLYVLLSLVNRVRVRTFNVFV